LSELGVGPNDVIVEVLEEPSRGMLGLGSRPARVRLQLLVSAPARPAEPEPVEDDEDEVADEYDEDEYTEDEYDDDDEYDEGGEENPEDGGDYYAAPYEGPLDEDAEVGKVVLTELLEKMEYRTEVIVRRAEPEPDSDTAPPWLLEVTGPGDLSALIGRRGETLASLQYITRLITSRELQRRANIVVDLKGYKSRRMSKLNDLATRMADQAVEQGRTITLEPMPPYERRIIHLALRDREDVETRSVGEGSGRKVTIVPL
jgi:spoIIIJ-associated protein